MFKKKCSLNWSKERVNILTNKIIRRGYTLKIGAGTKLELQRLAYDFYWREIPLHRLVAGDVPAAILGQSGQRGGADKKMTRLTQNCNGNRV